jgi:futalosine hydrolase
MKILLAAATQAEIAPTIDWLRTQDASVQERIDVLTTGVGIMATTFSLTQALHNGHYDFVLGAGIAGAFDRRLHLGECVIVLEEELGDMGAEDHEKFLDLFDLGLQQKDDAPFINGRLHFEYGGEPSQFHHANRRSVRGLTVNTVSGSAPTIAARMARYGAQIESMEGAALHYVCLKMGKPFLQLRAISNYVTPRDRAAWKIGEAVAALNAQLVEWLRSLA